MSFIMSFLLWRKICLARKENIFRYVNIVFCTFDTIIFYLVYQDKFIKKKYNKYEFVDYGVIMGVVLQVIRYLLSWMLFFSIKYEKRKAFRLWCYLDVILIVTLLAFIFMEFLHIVPLYYIVLIISCLVRIYGLWIVYSYSLDTDLHFDPKVYYIKKEENESATVQIQNNNLDNCPTCVESDNVEGSTTNLSTSLSFSSLNSSRYYLPPV